MKSPLVAMADALGREYKTLPTDLIGLQLSPTSKILINARILTHRNEQAKIASADDSADPNKPKGPSLADKIKSRRMRWQAERAKTLREMGLSETDL